MNANLQVVELEQHIYGMMDVGQGVTKDRRTIIYIYIPYPRERGPMGGAPYIGPRLGGGPIFEVSVSHLYAKERPGKLPTLAS